MKPILSFRLNLDCLDSYGMTKCIFMMDVDFMLKPQPDLSGNPFLPTFEFYLNGKLSAKKIGSGRRK